MSRILDKLKQAEAQRTRALSARAAGESAAAPALIVPVAAGEAATRRELEQAGLAQAQSRLAAETAARIAAEQRAGQAEATGGSRWLVAGAVAAAGIFAALGFYATPDRKETIAAGTPAGEMQLKLDRNLDSFTQRLKESAKP